METQGDTSPLLYIDHYLAHGTFRVNLHTGENLDKYAALMEELAVITEGIRRSSQAAQRREWLQITPAKSRIPQPVEVEKIEPPVNDKAKEAVIEKLRAIERGIPAKPPLPQTDPEPTPKTKLERGIGQQYQWPRY
jgi:hypothetical protein